MEVDACVVKLSHTQNDLEDVTATFNDVSIDWLYRILASAEIQYRALERMGKHEGHPTEINPTK
jgi:hypothetical protein